MKNKKRKGMRAAVLLYVFSVIISALFCGGGAYALEDPEITDTSCVYLYNITNDAVLYSKNTELPIYPASTVKIMSALIAIERWNKDWDTQITVKREMLRDVAGNNINLRTDEVVTFRDLINCVVIGGANDCASVLAYEICGSTDEFVKLMNDKAKELGMNDTVYKNVTGIHDPEMRTNLSDTVKLAKYALVQYKYFDIACQHKYVMHETNKSGIRNVYTKNAFMTSYYNDKYYSADVKGINAGATEEAGYCAVVTAEHDGTSYLAIAMGAGYDDDDIYSYVTIRSMLDWAYEHFGYVTIVKDSEIIKEVPVNMSAGSDKAALYAKNTVEVFMNTDIDVNRDIKKTVVLNDDELDAPLKQGDVIGYLTLSYNDEILERVELVIRSDIPRSEMLYISEIIKTVFLSDYAVAIMAVIVLGTVIYIIVRSTASEKEKKARMAASVSNSYETPPEQLVGRMRPKKSEEKEPKRVTAGTESTADDSRGEMKSETAKREGAAGETDSE